jgi:hypothetical protein
MAVLWVVVPCNLVEVYWHSRDACCLHHQGNSVNFYQTTWRNNPGEDSHLKDSFLFVPCLQNSWFKWDIQNAWRTTSSGSNLLCLLPFKGFSLYVEANKNCNLIIIQINYIFLYIISTSTDPEYVIQICNITSNCWHLWNC